MKKNARFFSRCGGIFRIFLCTILFFGMQISVAAETVQSDDSVHPVGKNYKTVKVGWAEDSAYYITGANGNRSGYSYEYLQEIAARTGWKYEYVKAALPVLMEMLVKGEVDLVGTVSYTEGRAENMFFSEIPMGEERYFLYADLAKSDFLPSDIYTIDGNRIGVFEAGVPLTLLNEFESNHNLHTEHINIISEEDSIKKIEGNVIDGFISIESPQWDAQGFSSIAYIGNSDIYFTVNKNRPDLKYELDYAMRKIEYDNPFYRDNLYQRFMTARSLQLLDGEEIEWIKNHGAIRVGFYTKDSSVSFIDKENGDLHGIINDYIQHAENCLGNQALKFELVGFDSQEKQIQAIKDGKIDMIFHLNQNYYAAEQNDLVLSNKVFEINAAAITNKLDLFDENARNVAAITKGNLLSKWYVIHNYPQWKIVEYNDSATMFNAVRNGEADCVVTKAVETSQIMNDKKLHSVFLTKQADSVFAVNRDNSVLLSILNKTLKTLPSSKLSGAISMYDNAPKKVSVLDFIRDNGLFVSVIFLIILMYSFHLFANAKKSLKIAEKANSAKSNFLFNMSHDIRTPMNALLGYNELIKKELTNSENPNPKLLDYQQKIEQSGNLLMSIINNVLDMARIESGKTELDENYVNVEVDSKAIYEVFKGETEKKGITFIHELKVLHPHIMCDATKIKEIMVNLLSNAVKYTPNGGTIIFTSEEIPCDKKGYVRIKNVISDNGIGMSKEFLPSIFDSFAREKNTTIGKVAGTGLGMPIVKKYVDMMNGKIDVQSELGKGTTFTIIFEYKIADRRYYEHLDSKTPDFETKKSICGKKILLAEDNDLNAEIAMAILSDFGLKIERVIDGIQCVAKIEQEPAKTYDLILMDIQMPNMDGYTATQKIRRLKDKEKSEIPIIAMTANAFEEDKKEALLAGMNGHISKPIDMEKFEKLMVSVLNQSN